ncbi:MAG: PilZ domain-containing protein [Terriglobales bacterium]|jgi:CheY-like chemotaxis protein
MNLDSLLVCSDDRALRVLRNVLGELEIHVEHCADHVSAAKKLAQQSFEAVIIDCDDEHSFGLLTRIRSGQQNRKAVAIAIIDARTNLQTAFKLGANFVVYKPITTEKVKSSFRAARALMKRERRRSVRLEVNIPAYFRFQNGDGEQAPISGLSEGGISVRFGSSPGTKSGLIAFSFALPDTTTVIEATGMIAWQDSRRRAGLQFATLPDASHQSLKEWLRLQSGEIHDPPIRCSLMGLSFGGCFLRTQSPFPAQTRVELLLRAADCSVKTAGKVRVMDPELGMGIEFFNRTFEHRRRLEQLIRQMTASPDAIAEVLVEPEGLDWDESAADSSEAATHSPEEQIEHDPFLELFRTWPSLTKKQFLAELEKHQLADSSGSASELNLPEPVVHQRREPRIGVARPVEVRSEDYPESFPQNTSLIDVSHRGARVDGVGLRLQVGEVVHLLSDGVEARFQVIWVGEPGTPQEGQIGLQRMTVDD